MSVLTDRNYIRGLLGPIWYHMLPKSSSSKEAEMVDVAGIDTRILACRQGRFTLPR